MTLLPSWRTSLWLLLSTVLIPAALALSVGILILVFYREAWDVAFGVLVLCFAVFALAGASATVFLLRRSARLATLQADFIANISHDFRTPLTSIRMFVETLRDQPDLQLEERARCLELLGQETERMDRLVQRVLAFRRADQLGAAGAARAPAMPEELLALALQPFETDPRGERLQRVVEPSLPVVLVDADAVVEAVRALVDNALKHSTEPGPVVVSLHTDGEGVALSVRDPGPTIPRRERKRVFRRFYRAPGAQGAGSGIGLSVAADVARAHGGQLELSSHEGLGNVFLLRLPVAALEPVARPEPVAKPEPRAKPGPRA